MADKRYFSYAHVHEAVESLAVESLVPNIKKWKPDVIVAIGGGGFIPGRMLRSHMKQIPLRAVTLKLYDATNTGVEILQWIDAEVVAGKRVLVVDEVDDTRKTLAACVAELKKSKPAAVAVAVMHNKNKNKNKKALLPYDVDYMCSATLPDLWYCYPWETSMDIRDHERKAEPKTIVPGLLTFLAGCAMTVAVLKLGGIKV